MLLFLLISEVNLYLNMYFVYLCEKINDINNPHTLAWLKIIVIILEIYNNIASSVLCVYI